MCVCVYNTRPPAQCRHPNQLSVALERCLSMVPASSQAVAHWMYNFLHESTPHFVFIVRWVRMGEAEEEERRPLDNLPTSSPHQEPYEFMPYSPLSQLPPPASTLSQSRHHRPFIEGGRALSAARRVCGVRCGAALLPPRPILFASSERASWGRLAACDYFC